MSNDLYIAQGRSLDVTRDFIQKRRHATRRAKNVMKTHGGTSIMHDERGITSMEFQDDRLVPRFFEPDPAHPGWYTPGSESQVAHLWASVALPSMEEYTRDLFRSNCWDLGMNLGGTALYEEMPNGNIVIAVPKGFGARPEDAILITEEQYLDMKIFDDAERGVFAHVIQVETSFGTFFVTGCNITTAKVTIHKKAGMFFQDKETLDIYVKRAEVYADSVRRSGATATVKIIPITTKEE